MPSLKRRDCALITLACVVSDIDGLGIVPELLTRHSAHPLAWFSLYHHRLHNLEFAIAVTAVAWILVNRTWLTCAMVFTTFHVHLFEHVIGARPRRQSVADSVPELVCACGRYHMVASVGAQRMAQFRHHYCAASGNAISHVEPWIFTA